MLPITPSKMDAPYSQKREEKLLTITNINKEVIFHKMVFESRNLGPSASNSACGSTAKKVTVNRLRFAIAFPSREYDPENMLFGAISPSYVL